MKRTADFHWLAGLLEGEGCFTLTAARRYKSSSYRYAKISLNMTDRDVVERAAALLGARVHRVVNGRHKPSFQAVISGSRALKMMQGLAPFMGARRRQRIAEIASLFPREKLK